MLSEKMTVCSSIVYIFRRLRNVTFVNHQWYVKRSFIRYHVVYNFAKAAKVFCVSFSNWCMCSTVSRVSTISTYACTPYVLFSKHAKYCRDWSLAFIAVSRTWMYTVQLVLCPTIFRSRREAYRSVGTEVCRYTDGVQSRAQSRVLN